MNEAIKQLIDRWAKPDGIPLKGELINKEGCMCAQGQTLHYIGGYSAEQLRGLDQQDADKETARLLGISTTHAILLRHINDLEQGAPSIVLTDPEQVLGDQVQTVLAFWRHLDTLTENQLDTYRSPMPSISLGDSEKYQIAAFKAASKAGRDSITHRMTASKSGQDCARWYKVMKSPAAKPLLGL